jgi:hypothetical protein
MSPHVGERLLDERGRTVGQPRPSGCLGRFQSQIGQCEASLLLGVGYLIPQVERAFVLLMGLGEAVHVGGGSGGSERCAERPGIVACGIPVMGQLGRGLASYVGMRVTGEGAGHSGVQAEAFPREQLAIDCLLQQYVAKSVPVPFGPEHLAVDRLTGRGQQSLLGESGGGGQQVVLDRASHRGGQPQDLPGVLGQCCNACQQDPLKPARELLPGLVGLGREQLLGQERVAARPREDALDGGGGGWPAEDAAEQQAEVSRSNGASSRTSRRRLRSSSANINCRACRGWSSSLR